MLVEILLQKCLDRFECTFARYGVAVPLAGLKLLRESIIGLPEVFVVAAFIRNLIKTQLLQ